MWITELLLFYKTKTFQALKHNESLDSDYENREGTKVFHVYFWIQCRELYLDVSHPGSLSGLENFYRVLKEKKIKINRQQVKEWLASQEAYTMHRRMLKKFPRNKVITRGIDDLWQIDLADMQYISKYNDNFRYLVTCIDVFGKFALVIPIKNKQAKSVLEAFNSDKE
jgi:hypothetical protein